MKQLHLNPQLGPKYISGHFAVQLTPKNPSLQAVYVSIETNDNLAYVLQFQYIDYFKTALNTCTVSNCLIPGKFRTALRPTYKILYKYVNLSYTYMKKYIDGFINKMKLY